jgi:uncharacterized membrane protein YjjP (DUF1212 family)
MIGTIAFPLFIIFPLRFISLFKVFSISFLTYSFSQQLDGRWAAFITSFSTLIIVISLLLRGHQLSEKKIEMEFLFHRMIGVQVEFLSFLFSVISIPLMTRISLLMKLLRELKTPSDFYHLGFKVFLLSIYDYATFLIMV